MKTENGSHVPVSPLMYLHFYLFEKESFQGEALWTSILTFLFGVLSSQSINSYCDGYSDLFCMVQDLLTISEELLHFDLMAFFVQERCLTTTERSAELLLHSPYISLLTVYRALQNSCNFHATLPSALPSAF